MLSFLKVACLKNESVMVRAKKKKIFCVFAVSFFRTFDMLATFVAAAP
jgi:hypothetical protein